MGVLAEAVIAAFDPDTELTWALDGVHRAVARFEAPPAQVVTTFEETAKNQWRVGLDVTSKASAVENVRASIRIFSGAFQAVREFLEVRQPNRLVFASKEEALWHLYEEYLRGQDTPLRQMGYRVASPPAEFAIEKSTPSEWAE